MSKATYEAASTLAKLYGECININNKQISARETLRQFSSQVHGFYQQIDAKAEGVSKDIRGEQIKYRKFDNYLRYK